MSRKGARGWPADGEPLPVPVIDNHTHLDMVLEWEADGWPGERSSDLTGHLQRAHDGGIARMVHCACDLDALAWADEAVTAHRALLAAVAIHPNEAVLHAGVQEAAPDGLTPKSRPRHDVPLADAIAAVAKLAATNPRVRAIGETGLDYFRAGPAGRAVQRDSFRAHIALAKELGLALQIHDRDAHQDVVDVLLSDGAPDRTVFHCFSGGVELAEVCADNGWYCSFAGPLTYKSNADLRAAAAVLPAHLLMVETDAPYLTPVPHRGQPNAPYVMGHTVRMLGQVRQTSLDEVCRQVSANAERVYGDW